MDSDIRYYCYPRTEEPPPLAEKIAQAFRAHEAEISTKELDDGLKSNDVLDTVRPELEELGFDIEEGKREEDKVLGPTRYGKNGGIVREHAYELDGYHNEKYVLEVEAGQGWENNNAHRDLIRVMTMPRADTLVLAVPNLYKHSNGESRHFDNIRKMAERLFISDRVDVPFRLVLLGY